MQVQNHALQPLNVFCFTIDLIHVQHHPPSATNPIMKTFLVLISTEKPIVPEEYASLFPYFGQFKAASRIMSGSGDNGTGFVALFGICFDGDSRKLLDGITEHVTDRDEVAVFYVVSASWHASPQRVERMKMFLNDSSGHVS